MIVNRSLSHGGANGVSVHSGKKAKSNPAFVTGFEGLNLYQQRYARGGNHFTIEPPDQALCVGNGYAAVDGNSVWIASEAILHTCSYADWGGPFFAGGSGDNLLGTCGGAAHGPGPRTALGNWSTYISRFTP